MIKTLYDISKPITKEFVKDPYTMLAYTYNIENYRIITGYDFIDYLLHHNVNHYEYPDYIKDFINSREMTLAIFTFLDGVPASVKLRTIVGEKDFKSFGESIGFQMPYQFTALRSDFKYGDKIVVVEGEKDCDSLRALGVDAIANRTSSLSLVACELVTTLTDNITLLYDNDEVGNKQKYFDRKKIKEQYGIDVKLAKQYGNYKDSGSIADVLWEKGDDSMEYQNLVTYYKNV